MIMLVRKLRFCMGQVSQLGMAWSNDIQRYEAAMSTTAIAANPSPTT